MNLEKLDDEFQEEIVSLPKKEWNEACKNTADKLVPRIEEMTPNPFNEQIRRNKILDLTTIIASNELVEILIEGFKLLAKSQNSRIIEFLHQLQEKSTHSEEFKEGLESNDLENLCALLQIDDDLLTEINQWAYEEFNKKNLASSSSLFGVLALFQNYKPSPWFQFAFSLYQQGKYILACQAAETAHALMPDQINYTLLLAACYDALESKDKVEELLNQIEQTPSHSDEDISEEWMALKEELLNKVKL